MRVVRQHGIALVSRNTEYQRNIVSACPHSGAECLADSIFLHFDSAVCGIVLDCNTGRNTGTECRTFFLEMCIRDRPAHSCQMSFQFILCSSAKQAAGRSAANDRLAIRADSLKQI